MWFTTRGNPRPMLAQRRAWRQSPATVRRGKRRADQGRRPLQRPEVRPHPYRVVIINYHYRIEGAPRPAKPRNNHALAFAPATIALSSPNMTSNRSSLDHSRMSGCGLSARPPYPVPASMTFGILMHRKCRWQRPSEDCQRTAWVFVDRHHARPPFPCHARNAGGLGGTG